MPFDFVNNKHNIDLFNVIETILDSFQVTGALTKPNGQSVGRL